MLLFVEQQSHFQLLAEPPAWVSEWLAQRQQRAAKQEAKLVAPDTIEHQEAKEVLSPTSQKRDAKRRERMLAGMTEFEQWLHDQVKNGLAPLEFADKRVWEHWASRMVDAQLPGLASRIRDFPALIEKKEAWATLLIKHMGCIQCLIDAGRQLERLSVVEAADVEAALGLPMTKEAVLQYGERITDHWMVLGIVLEERSRLWERRVWLLGASSQRLALLVDFSHGTPHFADVWLTGEMQSAQLAFYPSALLRRALVCLTPAECAVSPFQFPFLTVEHALDQIADTIAVQPWLSLYPMLLHSMVLVKASHSWYLQNSEGHSIPLRISSDEAWQILAVSAGKQVDICGEWNGVALRMLSIWQHQQQIWSARVAG
jgi:hypothetical protein